MTAGKDLLLFQTLRTERSEDQIPHTGEPRMLSIVGLAVVIYAVFWVSTSEHEKAVAVREWIKEKFNRA